MNTLQERPDYCSHPFYFNKDFKPENRCDAISGQCDICSFNTKFDNKGVKMNRYFLRFGRWRDNEQSAIHKNGEFIVGYEKGVSCFDATLLEDGKWHLILPNPCKINTCGGFSINNSKFWICASIAMGCHIIFRQLKH